MMMILTKSAKPCGREFSAMKHYMVC